MKKTAITLLALAVLAISCKEEKKEAKETAQAETALPAVSDAMMENSVIYEANIRQYSPDGKFESFTKDIPRLKELGIKVIWVMPIHPIGVKDRKEGLGSYYSIKDYRGVNPEFGNLDDFKKLVQTAHDNGIYVIMDWVANHTARDHAWVTQHPDWYTKDKDGKILAPFDWTDVAELNYDNKDMRKAMVADMQYWLKEANVDGFRCDVAAEVPTDFWDDAVKQLKTVKPVFMLMEAEKPELMKNAFDMAYGWESHHLMNDIARGKKTVKDWDAYMKKRDTVWQKDDFTMYFTSNHDENSWNGTEYERMGDAVETFAALTYVVPGMPLVYNGQEYDFKERLKFFVKDTITKTKGRMYPVYQKLGKLKHSNPALNGGKNAASYNRIVTSDDMHVLAFVRERDGKQVYYIANLSKAPATFSLPVEGAFVNYMTGDKMEMKPGQKHTFAPWEYVILTKD
ncbi:alpha-amlyase [Nostoc linckia z16]|nr:alpha-amlyase [Nostoc linckia z16]